MVDTRCIETVKLQHLAEAIKHYEVALDLVPPDAVTQLARAHNQLGVAYQYSRTEQSKAVEHFKSDAGTSLNPANGSGSANACLNAGSDLDATIRG